MKTTNRISTAAFLAAASLTFSSPAWSLGLGDLTVESYLNQPLQVRIDLITRETDDLTAVTARLASADDYELIGASRDAIPAPIRFTVEDLEGEPHLLATSNLPMGNPVIRLIVEVNYASGRLLREYTVFLDPPTHAAQAPIPRVDKRKDPPAPQPEPEAAPVQADSAATRPEPGPSLEPEPSPQPDAAPVSTQPSQGEYGPVSNGETLWGIAKNWSRGTGMDINKVMIAIQRENPSAFLRGNINLLKRGAILRMPRAEDVRNISTAAAISEVSSQTDEFRGRRASETVASPSTPLVAEEADSYTEPDLAPAVEPSEPAAAEVEAETAAEAEEAVAQPDTVTQEVVEEVVEEVAEEPAQELEPIVQDQLELVPPSEESDLDSAYGFEESDEDPADASAATSALRENLARTEEELITQQQQNEYLQERIRELEAQLAEPDPGNVEDADMANMENRLREERQQQEAEPWYSQFSAWLIGLLVLVAAGAGWLFSRRGAAEEVISELPSEEEQLKEIKEEAEEVLKVLEEPDEPEEPEKSEEQAEDTAGAEETQEMPKAEAFGAGGDDAEVLDEESSDPEIQLDLARAYISMGDKEAARVILEEVQSNGNETQRDEAKKMLDLLVS